MIKDLHSVALDGDLDLIGSGPRSQEILCVGLAYHDDVHGFITAEIAEGHQCRVVPGGTAMGVSLAWDRYTFSFISKNS